MKRVAGGIAVLVALLVIAGSGATTTTGNVNWSGNGDQTVGAVDASGAPVTVVVTAPDASGPTDCKLTADGSPLGSGSHQFPLGVTQVECSTTDSGGQPATTDFTITVEDQAN